MSATMETNEDNETDTTDPHIAIAIQGADGTYGMVDAKPQDNEFPTPPVSEGSTSTSTTSNGSVLSYTPFPTTSEATSAIAFTDGYMTYATNEHTKYDPASPSFKIESTDTGYVSDDDVEFEEGSEIEFNEDGTPATSAGPARKTTRNAAMTAEQQRMRIMEINSALRMYNADPESRDFKNAPAYLQKPGGNGIISGSKTVNGSSSGSPNGTVQSSPPKQGPKRGSQASKEPKQNAKNGKKDQKGKKDKNSENGKKDKKEKKKKEKPEKLPIPPEVKNVLALLNAPVKPFDKTLKDIFDYAADALDKQQDNEGPIKDMLEIEDEWKTYQAMKLNQVTEDEWETYQAMKLKQVTTFLERNGLIPMGGVEAIATGRDMLG